MIIMMYTVQLTTIARNFSKRNRSDATEFAKKYIGGFYTYIDIKGAFEKAGLKYQEPSQEERTGNAAAATAIAAAAAAAGPAEIDDAAPSPSKDGKDMRGVTAEGLAAQLVLLKKGASQESSPSPTSAATPSAPSDAETAPLIA